MSHLSSSHICGLDEMTTGLLLAGFNSGSQGSIMGGVHPRFSTGQNSRSLQGVKALGKP